jgi:hypothetical protein
MEYNVIRMFKRNRRGLVMITEIEKTPVTITSYPFASAEKYCQLSKKG